MLVFTIFAALEERVLTIKQEIVRTALFKIAMSVWSVRLAVRHANFATRVLLYLKTNLHASNRNTLIP